MTDASDDRVVDERVSLRLAITGMTCAACAARVEKRLQKLDGVTASVNYATEQASVTFPANMEPTELMVAVESIGYGARLPETAESFAQQEQVDDDALVAHRRRLKVCALLTMPVLAISMFRSLQFDHWQWVVFVLTLPVISWGGWPFHRVALKNLRHRAATMDTLISVGTLAAFCWSTYALVFGRAGMIGMHMNFRLRLERDQQAEHLYFEVAAAVILFLLLGRYLEARAKRSAGQALQSLLSLGAKQCVVLDADGTERVISIDQLRVGQRFIVRPGEKVATDGVVVVGQAAVDSSLLTGESIPVDVGPGDSVVGSAIISNGRLVIQATNVGADTALARIGELVVQAQSGKAAVQRLADRVAAVFVPVVIALSVLTYIGWVVAGGQGRTGLAAAIAVLIIACPCALGLATPTALLVGTGRGAQLGMVISGPEVLEASKSVDTVVFDKTGTLTTGTMAVRDVVVVDGADRTHVVRMAGSLEHASEHPIGRALALAAKEHGPFLAVSSFVATPGFGVSGEVEGTRVEVSSVGGTLGDAALDRAVTSAKTLGLTVVVARVDGVPVAVLTLSDRVKPTSAEAVAALHSAGLRTVLLSGDSREVAQRVADEVGISEVIAPVSPEDKVAAIAERQAQGYVVAMCGDGVNDAAALAQANVGLVMGSGADAAIHAGDITLMTSDLSAVTTALALARATYRTILTNLFWAFAYNVCAIPLAAAGLLNPVIAGAAMACSSLFVVMNSLRLRRFQPVSRR